MFYILKCFSFVTQECITPEFKMELSQIKSYLSQIELFTDLNEQEIDLLATKFQVKELESGELVFQENAPRNHLYIIVQGKVELFKNTPFGKEKSLRIFEEKDFMGEGSLMDNYPHSTSTRMLEDGIVLKLNRNDFNELTSEKPEISSKIFAKIAQRISKRMRLTTSQVVGAAQEYISGKTRLEHDLLGDKEVPYEVYYGVQTLRALENFSISGIPISHYPHIIIGLAEVKMAAAIANHELGLLTDDVKDAIVTACREIINGKYHGHFAVDMIQGGAGTSTNMNANEVIANRALELLSKEKGEYKYCHPNNHVNLSQSTNDAYPTALKIALIYHNDELIKGLKELFGSFRQKGKEFSNIIKMGRTQLQDAVPMTLGQEFESFACTLEEEVTRLETNSKLFYEINMGGTAIGTGINADPRYSSIVTKKLSEITGRDLKLASNFRKFYSKTFYS
jgi:aspartate ammonia-lyase